MGETLELERPTLKRNGKLVKPSLFNRLRFRDAFVVVGVSMHIGIMTLMEVGMFSTLSLAFYPCFYHPDELRAGMRRLRAGRGGGRST